MAQEINDESDSSKLRTLGSASINANKTNGKNENTIQDMANQSASDYAEKIRQHKASNPSQVLPSGCTLSSVTTLRSGKETKDRRNRERLLQGHGSSEFSLSNIETDLELDYYDYNVANASAVPGSYLGMDPAFLVWIPPFLSGDSDILPADEEGQETTSNASEQESRLNFNVEGVTLTPAEYRMMRASRVERFASVKQIEDGGVKKSDSSETSSDDISESRTKLCERLLPIHRILEDSRIRVSDESLCGYILKDKTVPQNIIPNRLHDVIPTPDTEAKIEAEFSEKPRNRFDEEQRQVAPTAGQSPQLSRAINANSPNDGIRADHKSEKIKVLTKRNFQEADQWRIKHHQNQRGSKNPSEEESKNYNHGQVPTTLDDSAINRRRQMEIDEEKSRDQRSNVNLTNLATKYRDFTNLNSISETKNIAEAINIPMIEISSTQSRSPVKVHKSQNNKIVNTVKETIQSPDYGVESDIKDESMASFYDLICESEDRIKFADDDDEYIDNKINV